ncbi:hypothetical protein ISR94_03650 [Candidatus Microgenomates bacterium]|nr:hypothetical protein [Candidatus Microgenomates bacterium]
MAAAPTLDKLGEVYGNLVSALLAFGGIALFVMLLIGGFKYLTSGGDPKAAEEAKKTLTYAIGGVVLLAASFLVLQLIQDITGANVTEFSITRP